MANHVKVNRQYGEFSESLEKLARGDSVENLDKQIDKAFILFKSGYSPVKFPESDYASNILKNLYDYSSLSSKRNKVLVAGAERETATEQQALESLKLAHFLAKDFVTPNNVNKFNFSNHLFRDIYNLSLSYLDSIVDGVADEYIDPSETVEVKSIATDLARAGARICESYRESKNLNSDSLKTSLNRFSAHLSSTRENFMRPYELVFTSPKSIYKKEIVLGKLSEKLLTMDEDENLIFTPDVIFPIAHGGTEVGIQLANKYEDIGHFPTDLPFVYPLMYSMKTRKQNYPWVQNDASFLGKSLEGKNLLIVEDWVTTGNTVRGILQKLENTYPNEIRVATLKRDPDKSDVPILDKYKFYIGSWAKYKGAKGDELSKSGEEEI